MRGARDQFLLARKRFRNGCDAKGGLPGIVLGGSRLIPKKREKKGRRGATKGTHATAERLRIVSSPL